MWLWAKPHLAPCSLVALFGHLNLDGFIPRWYLEKFRPIPIYWSIWTSKTHQHVEIHVSNWISTEDAAVGYVWLVCGKLLVAPKCVNKITRNIYIYIYICYILLQLRYIAIYLLSGDSKFETTPFMRKQNNPKNIWKICGKSIWLQPCGNHLSTEKMVKNASGGTARSLEQLKSLPYPSGELT